MSASYVPHNRIERLVFEVEMPMVADHNVLDHLFREPQMKYNDRVASFVRVQ